jgi:hypothetical protein
MDHGPIELKDHGPLELKDHGPLGLIVHGDLGLIVHEPLEFIIQRPIDNPIRCGGRMCYLEPTVHTSCCNLLRLKNNKNGISYNPPRNMPGHICLNLINSIFYTKVIFVPEYELRCPGANLFKSFHDTMEKIFFELKDTHYINGINIEKLAYNAYAILMDIDRFYDDLYTYNAPLDYYDIKILNNYI